MGITLKKLTFVGLKPVSVVIGKYPAGESYVKIDSDVVGSTLQIHVDYKSDQDLWNLALVVDALQRAGCWAYDIHIPYLPYAREDRVMVEGGSLSLVVLCNFLVSLKYRKIYCKDLHSPVASALLKNLHEQTWTETAALLQHLQPQALLVSPDAGANKKVFEFAKAKVFPTVIRADKTRDVATGQITGTKVFLDEHVGDLDFLIMDDICDGGKTFIELAKELKKLTDGNVYLYVTHGIFSKGASVFEGLIDQIYVSNLMGEPHDLITVLTND